MTYFAVTGLSNPEVGRNRIDKSLTSGSKVPELLNQISSKTSIDVSSVIIKQIEGRNFNTGSVILLKHDNKTRELVREPSAENEIYILREFNNFYREFEGYTFSHTVIAKNTNGLKQLRASCVLIDEELVDKSIEEMGEGFKNFEKSLTQLFFLANHDYTVHGYNFALKSGYNHDEYITSKVKHPIIQQLSGKNHTIEIMAAMFHRDIIEELGEKGVKVQEQIFRLSRVILMNIEKIQDDKIREYWLKVLKYPLFSLVNPESDEIYRLNEEFPNINLQGTIWGKACHQHEIVLENGKSISVRALRKSLFKDLSSIFTTITPIRTKIALITKSYL